LIQRREAIAGIMVAVVVGGGRANELHARNLAADIL